MVTAYLKNYRQSPRKVRVVAGLIKGKRVADAITILNFAAKKASSPLSTLLKSAMANAKNNHQLDVDTLYVTGLQVDKGMVLMRSLPRAQGSASPIHKRCSHVMITLGEKPKNKKKK